MTPLELPDLPRWVEAHGIAADPASWRHALGDGYAVGSDVSRLIVIAGDADVAAAVALAHRYPGHAVLVAPEDAALARAIAGSAGEPERAVLHTLPSLDALPDLEGATPLSDTAPLSHLRPDVAEEIRIARGKGAMWSAWVDGVPVAFAYAPWRSAAWFDISVDVDPSARQLGLGAMVAAALIRDESERGRQAVWGADEGNVASRRLARHLGFVEVDELWVVAPRGAPGPRRAGTPTGPR